MELDGIKIGTAKWLTTSNRLDGVAIIAFKDGQTKAVSYGATRPKCDQLGNLIDHICERVIENGAVNLRTFEVYGQD